MKATACEGDGLFPAGFTCLICFRDRLAAAGQHPNLCPLCAGVIDLTPVPAVAEETPHAHHH